MSKRSPRSTMAGSEPLRRRSPRLSSPLANVNIGNKMAAPPADKRSITVRKIAPRKTTVPSEVDRENMPMVSGGSRAKKQEVSTPAPVSARVSEERKAAIPSPILPSTPPPTRPQPRPEDLEDVVWSKKVRRSYTRLSQSPDTRDVLFGFDKLETPEVRPRAGHSRTDPELSGSLCGLSGFSSLLEAEESRCALPELDPNIPGVVLVKEKRRRKKIQQVDTSEADALAAKMNREFDEAEEFQLVVE